MSRLIFVLVLLAFFSSSLMLASCAEANRSAGMALDSANSVITEASPKLWGVAPSPTPEAETSREY